MNTPNRIFLDTNVYIIGAAMADSPEAAILDWAGFGVSSPSPVEVIASEVLFEQILRVARRLHGKDWAGEILAHIWQGMTIRFVFIDPDEIASLEINGTIPREDIEIYLAARAGEAECFISANRELIRVIARRKGEFDCYTPEEFVIMFLSD